MTTDAQRQSRVAWDEEQTNAVLKLYLQSYGQTNQLSEKSPDVIKEAELQDRAAKSVYIKLRNFRYLDPRCEARDQTGMKGFTKQDAISWRSHSGLHYSKRALDFMRERRWDEILAGECLNMIGNTALEIALLTKPFLILTGPSGTGKTRGAVRLADSICGNDAHRLVAVGADWTDNRHVLGYLNPLETVTEEEDVFPIYETTPILDLILHADANPDEPHVLILDEMNLSHVERYFADFLSAMELKDKTDALKLHSAGMARSRTGAEIQGSIDFPANLFVIGTVNIDETTYMFSPKVLDRANVIEIHADKTEMGNFLKDIETARPEEAAKDYGIAFLDAARVIQGEGENAQVPALPTAVRDAAAEHLMTLFKIMARGRAEYGFRTGKEVKAYLRTAHFLAGPEPAARAAWAAAEGDWLKALDAQILQKILPKLHGSRTRLAPLLGALATYCATGTEEYAKEHFPENGVIPKRSLKDANGNKNAKFPESYKKLERMIAVLVEEQFVSFIC